MRDPVLYRSIGARPCIRVKEPIGFVLTRPQSFIPRWMMGMGKVPPCLSSPNLQTGKSARKLGLARDCGCVRVLRALFELSKFVVRGVIQILNASLVIFIT